MIFMARAEGAWGEWGRGTDGRGTKGAARMGAERIGNFLPKPLPPMPKTLLAGGFGEQDIPHGPHKVLGVSEGAASSQGGWRHPKSQLGFTPDVELHRSGISCLNLPPPKPKTRLEGGCGEQDTPHGPDKAFGISEGGAMHLPRLETPQIPQIPKSRPNFRAVGAGPPYPFNSQPLPGVGSPLPGSLSPPSYCGRIPAVDH